MKRAVVIAALLSAILAAPAAGASKQYGYIEFPRDEHQHFTGLDYWWGAANLYTKQGNHYTVGIAFDAFYGVGVTGHEVFAHQGPYKGKSLLSVDGPAEWGHPNRQVVSKISAYVPGVSERLSFETYDPSDSMRRVGTFERTSLDRETYRIQIDNNAAKVHPSGEAIKVKVDLNADMKSPPLLAGGTGRWWYGIPETYKYPSRSFHYTQAARKLTGTIEIEQPDGSSRVETIVPSRSTVLMTHEYDATPEDIGAGLAVAEATQLHERYPQYYEGGMPWELLFIDLDNGAQLMVAVLAFHETEKGTLTPAIGQDQPTYRVLSTLRLKDGRSVALDEAVQVEHLAYRTLVGHTPTLFVSVKGVWKQAWKFRLRYPGGKVKAGDGSMARVPAFDLGVTPQLGKSEPAADPEGNRLVQRVPYDAAGSYGGCPVHGFGWSELIIQWSGREDRDPWWTGGDVPPVPKRCGPPNPAPPGGQTGPLTPEFGPTPPPDLAFEGGCQVIGPDTCAYEATKPGGVSGIGSEPGGWAVRITRPGASEPIVIPSHGGHELYACGTIRPGDRVEVTAEEGSQASAGDPLICF